MSLVMPRAVVLRGLYPGSPAEPVAQLGIPAPFEVIGFTQVGQDENPYNVRMPKAILGAEHLFIDETLIEDRIPRSVVRAISAALIGLPGEENIWAFTFDSPDPPRRLADRATGRSLTQTITKQREGEQ